MLKRFECIPAGMRIESEVAEMSKYTISSTSYVLFLNGNFLYLGKPRIWHIHFDYVEYNSYLLQRNSYASESIKYQLRCLITKYSTN